MAAAEDTVAEKLEAIREDVRRLERLMLQIVGRVKRGRKPRVQRVPVSLQHPVSDLDEQRVLAIAKKHGLRVKG